MHQIDDGDDATRTPSPAEPLAAAPHGVDVSGRKSRRDFLGDAVGAAGIAATAWLWADGLAELGKVPSVDPTEPGAPGRTFNTEQWKTLEAACDRLLPSEGPASPGARDVNAIGYLDALLSNPDVKPTWPPLVLEGAATLDKLARRQKKTAFASLSAADQDGIIQRFEAVVAPDGSRPGHTWLRVMLAGILEAFFCDPARGGNPGEIAWKWAGHKPGFPRPPTPGWLPTERKA